MPSIRNATQVKWQDSGGLFAAADESPLPEAHSPDPGRMPPSEFPIQPNRAINQVLVESDRLVSPPCQNASATAPAEPPFAVASRPREPARVNPSGILLEQPESAAQPSAAKIMAKRSIQPGDHEEGKSQETPGEAGQTAFTRKGTNSPEILQQMEFPRTPLDESPASGMRRPLFETPLFPAGHQMSHRPFHVNYDSQGSLPLNKGSAKEAKTIAQMQASPEMLPSFPVSQPTSPGPSDQPKVVIGRLSVEVVPVEPISMRPAPKQVRSSPPKPPPDLGMGSRMKLRFGLGQI